MTLTFHLRGWLFALVRTPGRAVLTLLMVVLLIVTGGYGWREYRFRQARSAARLALSEYDFPTALAQLDTCLRLRPGDPELLLLAVQAARREGLLNRAEEYLNVYREQMETPTPAAALQSSLLQVQRGKVKEFVPTFLDFLEVRHPDSEQILEALAQGCISVYRLDEATFWIKQLLDRFPKNPIGRLLSAQTNETLRRREQAFNIARQLVDDFPRNERARLFLADLLFRTHRYDEAIEQYQAALRLKPKDFAPLLGLIRSLVTLDRLAEAESLVEKLEREHSDNSEALLECGRFALRQKRPEEAERLLQRALELNPNDHEIHLELAVCLGLLNRTEQARQHQERFKQIQADMQELEKAFQAMVKSPSDPTPRLQAGRICLRNGQIQEGLRWLAGALELAPNHKPTHQALAEYYESQGNTTQAEYHRARSR